MTATAFDIVMGFDGPSEQPRYADRDGTLVAGAGSGAQGGFVNVPSGLYVVRFAGASATCTPSTGLYGFPAGESRDGEALLLVPVIEGYVTAPVGVSCTSAQ